MCMSCTLTCRVDLYDYVRVKEEPPIELQQNEAYCTRVQLQQNVCYSTSFGENDQQQQQYVSYSFTIKMSFLALQDG